MNKADVLDKIIRPAIKKANMTMPNFSVSENEEVVLYGLPNAVLDSMGLVSFVFILEDQIETIISRKVTITTEDVLNPIEPPFKSIESLAVFLQNKIDKK